MGIYQHQQGDFQGALRQYQRVISLTGNDIAHYGEIRHEIFANMASAYNGLGDFVRARECLESAVSLNPDRKSTRLNSSHLGISYAVFSLKKHTGNDNMDT